MAARRRGGAGGNGMIPRGLLAPAGGVCKEEIAATPIVGEHLCKNDNHKIFLHKISLFP
jgi:hypothetical protein